MAVCQGMTKIMCVYMYMYVCVCVCVCVCVDRTVRVGKRHWRLKYLLGAKFGSVFEGSEKEKALLPVRIDTAHVAGAANDDDGDEDNDNNNEDGGGDGGGYDGKKEKSARDDEKDEREQKDNRNLVDTNTAQELDGVKILAMRKSENKSGREIVAALCDNSKTYASKTAFSQEKYRKKKEMKYVTRIAVHRPTATTIARAIAEKDPRRIAGLRWDTLAMLLLAANVGEEARILVVDGTAGLVTAAAMERGAKTVCVAHCGGMRDSPNLELVRCFNFDSAAAKTSGGGEGGNNLGVGQEKACVHGHTDTTGDDNGSGKDDEPATFRVGFRQLREVFDGNNDARASPSDPASAAAQEAEKIQEAKAERRRHKCRGIVARATRDELALIRSTRFSGLICCDPSLDPVAVYAAVRPALAPSASVAFFHTSIQPLAELMTLMMMASPKPKAPHLSLSSSPAFKSEACDTESRKRRKTNGAEDGSEHQQADAEMRDDDDHDAGEDEDEGAKEGSPNRVGNDDGGAAATERLPALKRNDRADAAGGCINVQLVEPWLREYQVLPQRTHPNMNMSGTGGYMLSAVYVGSDSAMAETS